MSLTNNLPIEERHRMESGKETLNSRVSNSAINNIPETYASNACPRILVIGPGPAQIGGVATFNQILLSSATVAEKYEVIHLDTTRAPEDLGLEGRFLLRNLRYFLIQIGQLITMAIRYRPSIMHLPVTSRLSFWKTTVLILTGKALGMKVVAHLHGGMFDKFYRKSPKLLQKLIGWVLSRADVVIALSTRWRGFLLEEVRPDLYVEIVRNTVDEAFAKASELDHHGDDRTNNEVLFVGGLGYRKGVYDILKAVPIVRNTHPDVMFVFAGGEAARGDRETIDKCCEEAGLGSVVRFLGPVTGSAKLKLFQRAALFILPSYGENLPYALLEAMASGLPVITTPVGAIPEIVENGYHGFLIQPGDYEMLAENIIHLLEDEELRRRMGFANRLLIQSFYLPDVAMTRLVAIYDKLINPSTPMSVQRF